MQNNNVIAYKNVFSRNEAKQFTFEDFIQNPSKIFNSFSDDSFEKTLSEIKKIIDKEERNIAKRNNIPAVDLSQTGVLSIDIDNIFDNQILKDSIIVKLKKNNSVLCLMDSVSGNLVVFFKYECSVADYPFLYYKIYLELTLLLSVNIDFLPEIGRLRYISNGEIYVLNKDSECLTEILRVETLPYINTSVGKEKARRVIFGSK